MPAPTVFISYSHKDEVWKNRLVEHLGILERENRLRTWNDRRIKAGQEWLPEIETAMNEARVAVLLISTSFLNSDFIRSREVPLLLERRVKEGVHVFPVIVKDCLWEEVGWLSSLQVRPQDGKALETVSASKRNGELKKIAKEILEILEGQTASPRLPTLATSPPLRPLHQLPPPPADFVGRETDLAELRTAMEKGGATICGMGGLGKTALALKLAEEVAPRYPDAQIYLDLQGVSPNPLTPSQAMAHVIRAFHPEARLPEGEAELAGLYLSTLHDKRVLLLMDNAADAAQVQPLLSPKTCSMLVTSRNLFTLPGLLTKNLDDLPHDKSCDLLLAIAPRIAGTEDRIAEICGGLPIALRLAGGTLAERPDLSPAAYAQRLASAKQRLGLVEGSLSLSYDLLSKEVAARWCRLAVFPASFDAVGAAAIWEMEPGPAGDLLGDLVKRSLVEGEDGRYRLHDLARVFADSRLSESDQVQARQRHAQHYCNVAALADDLYLLGGEDLLEGLRLFDSEWGNIQAGQAWAATRAKDDKHAAKLASVFPDAGVYCLNLRLQARERIRWLESAVEASRIMNDRRREGAALGNLGLAYAALGETRRAIEIYEQRLTIAREIGDRRGEGAVLGNLGNAYMDLGETRRAIQFYEQHLDIAREIGDRRGEGNALGNLGSAYANLGETRRAIGFYEQHLDIAREIGDRRGEGNALGNLGSAYANLGETRRAIEIYEQRLNIAREIGDRLGEGKVLGNLGSAYADLGETRRAIEIYEQRLNIAREIGDRQGEAIASWNLGDELAKSGNLARAAELMQVRVDYKREIGHSDAEKYAARVAALRARIEQSTS